MGELSDFAKQIRNQLIADGGSVQRIEKIPQHLKEIYKTVWEIKQKAIIDMAADRGAFIDQSQSLNLFVSDANVEKLTSMHFYSWKRGLKTGMYYLRTRAATQAIQFTVDAQKREKNNSSMVSQTDITGNRFFAKSDSVYGDICSSCSG